MSSTQNPGAMCCAPNGLRYFEVYKLQTARSQGRFQLSDGFWPNAMKLKQFWFSELRKLREFGNFSVKKSAKGGSREVVGKIALSALSIVPRPTLRANRTITSFVKLMPATAYFQFSFCRFHACNTIVNPPQNLKQKSRPLQE